MQLIKRKKKSGSSDNATQAEEGAETGNTNMSSNRDPEQSIDHINPADQETEAPASH